MKILECLNNFSLFRFKSENYSERKSNPSQDKTSYVLKEINNKTYEYTDAYIKGFLNLIEDDLVQQFLAFDCCYKYADNYLLAIVFTYFIRAELPLSEYNQMNFFVALYLAHDLEEDDEDLKCTIMRWGLGVKRTNEIEYFLSLRDCLWKSMDFRACVSMQCCLQVMRSFPECDLWQRSRSPAHAGAGRFYNPEEKCFRCGIPSFSFCGSGCDTDDSEVDSSDEDEIQPIKRMKLNEE